MTQHLEQKTAKAETASQSPDSELRGAMRTSVNHHGETHLTIYANQQGEFYLMRVGHIRSITAKEATDILRIVDSALRMAGVTFGENGVPS